MTAPADMPSYLYGEGPPIRVRLGLVAAKIVFASWSMAQLAESAPASITLEDLTWVAVFSALIQMTIDGVTGRVHVLRSGWAACGKPGRPVDWDDGHRWVDERQWREATCPACRGEAAAALMGR